jgi:ribosomal protein S18 acetylase RimI-like enzyme
MAYKLVPFAPGLEADFFRLHCPANEAGWCFCVAWWVESWQGWGERTAEENHRLRESLLAAGEYDGYLLFDDDEPAAWCQAGRRDRLSKLVKQMQLLPDSETWAITCFLVAPAYRRQGIAGQMLAMVLTDLRRNGVRTVEAYPKRGSNLDALDLWNGPETMYISAGFEFVKEVAQRAVLRLAL